MTSIQLDTSIIGSVKGKVVLITGGASGIGKAAVQRFHSLGAKIAVGDLDEKHGLQLSTELGPDCFFQKCDVTQWSSIYGLFESAVEKYGHVDVVLANAGIPEIEDVFHDEIDASTGKLKEPKWKVLDVDLKGVLNTVKIAKFFFKGNSTPGCIVITASTAAYSGDGGIPIYAASKHGVVGLMRSISRSGPFKDQGIRVNCVAPFFTESGFVKPGMKARANNMGLPVNKASSVADAILLCVVTQSYTGRTIYVAEDKLTEIELPWLSLRATWLGSRNDELLTLSAQAEDLLTIGQVPPPR